MMGGDTVISLIEQVREHLIVDPGLSSLKTALDALNATVTINAKIVAAPAWRGVAEAASFAAMVGSEAAVRRAENTFTVDGWLDIQDFISHAKRGEPINDSDVSRLYERIKESFTKALSGATSSVELRTHFASWGHFLSIILIILAILTIYQAYEIADQSSQALRDVKGEVQSQHELDRQQREELEKKRAEKESRFMELQEEANRLIREGNEIARRKIEERECQALYIVATPTTMTVNPDASSEQLVELCVGDEVELKEDAGDWIRALWYDALTGQVQLGWVPRSHVERLDR